MPSHFKVKEYCPLVFRNLRERFNVDDVDYRESLTRSQPLCIDSPGKSGAQFYQSYDKLYILKSLTSEEVERMHSFLKHYHPVGSHKLDSGATEFYNSLLCPFCSTWWSVMEIHCCHSIWACTG